MNLVAAVMVHPLVRLAASRPQMLAEHVAAYADLVADEATNAATQWKRRVSFQVIGIGCLAAAVILGGIAVMLWASLPTLNAPWVVVLTPLVPALFGGAALRIAASGDIGDPFAPLQRQLAADAAMLRGAGES